MASCLLYSSVFVLPPEFICVDISRSGSYIHVIPVIVRVFPVNTCATIYLSVLLLKDT